MSRQAEQRVWERARAKGSNLLVLVKLADWANEDGFDAFPSPQRLAAATRLTDRALRYILHKLERDGEIVIEANTDGRALTIGKRTFCPPWFIHIRCACEWELYQTEGAAANFSSEPFRAGRKRWGGPPEKIADHGMAGIGKDFPAIGTPASDYRKNHVPAYKEGSVRDLLDEQEQGVQGAAPPTCTSDDPEKNLNVITKLAHETIALVGVASLADLTDAVKARCAELDIRYYPPGDLVSRAIDSAIWQRAQRRAPAVS